MKVTLDKLSELERKLTIVVPAANINEKVDVKLNEISKTVRLPGFRPGKVPVKVVKQRFSDVARNDVLNESIQENLLEALKQEKVNPVDTPAIEFTQNEAGKDLEFVAKFEVLPELKIKDLDKIVVEKPVVKLVEADVDTMFVTLQNQHMDWTKTDKSAKEGDRVTIDYKGTIDGKVFEGGSSSNVPLILGSNMMMDGFEAGLVGAKKEETKELKLAFPQDYHAKDFAGKKVNFSITINDVEQSALPKLDKAFAKRFGTDSIEKLRTETKTNMTKELEHQLKARVKTQVMDGLIKNNLVEIPESLIANEVKRMQKQMIQQFQQGQGDKKRALPDMPVEIFHDEAKRRVSLGLLINHLIEEHKIVVNETKVKELVDQMTSVYDNPEEIAKYIMNDKQRLADVKYTVLEDQVVDFILESATIKDKAMSFSELMKPQTPSSSPEKKPISNKGKEKTDS